jgi:redox-sensing transcriptional repressor
MSVEIKVSGLVIKRLPRYYRYLTNLKQMGITRVTSSDLSKKIGVTPSQVRQDFFNFGGFGMQGYGYDVEFLHQEIGKILGLNEMNTMVIIGAGNLGQALAKHENFEKRSFKTIGIFDTRDDIIGEQIRGIEIMHFGSLSDFVKNNHVDIAIITVPKTSACEVLDTIIKLGIKGIWNFAPIDLVGPGEVEIENIHLSDSLMVLGYNMKKKPFTQM